ncbi:uncharacterized protein LOC135117462 [Helicoverpa armigera]|uniref:uncharacterized protein LOC135117462 n=1 Tax=Helicoverpa armigera TaxID=29058 RepID=UPI003083EDF7
MHGFSHFFHKHHRESTPPKDKDDSSSDSWLSATDSRNVLNDDTASSTSSGARPIPIHPRGSGAPAGSRASSGSPYEFAYSPRDRYPNFASYIRDVMERGSPSQHYYTHHPDYRRQRSDGDRYHSSVNTYHTPRNDYRNFVSPLFNDAMDDIQENEYSKCERYGEISSSKLSHRNRHDNKSFAQKLAETITG